MEAEQTVCNPVPLRAWIAEETSGPNTPCRPCLLPVAMNWYYTELEEQGHPDLADELERVKDTGDPLQVAETMDSIKGQVSGSLLERLQEFDCSLQSVQLTPEEIAAFEGESGAVGAS